MSNRPMYMSGGLIRFVAAVCAAVVLIAAPASAEIASPVEPRGGQHVVIGNKYEPASITLICGNGNSYSFNYRQRMTIDGVSRMVPTVTLYSPGRHILALLDYCDGQYIYGVGPAAV